VLANFADTDSLPSQLAIGRITGTYGLKGWVKVYSYTDPIEQISDYQPWLVKKVDSRNPLQVFEFVQVKRHGKGIIALPVGSTDCNQAQEWVGFEIWADQGQMPELDEGEYYWQQLHGLQVINSADEVLGRIDHILETGANDVLVVKADKDSIDDQERLIPYVEEQVVLKIDVDVGKMWVDWAADY
jgi:16S rRNA processing protein RimM